METKRQVETQTSPMLRINAEASYAPIKPPSVLLQHPQKPPAAGVAARPDRPTVQRAPPGCVLVITMASSSHRSRYMEQHDVADAEGEQQQQQPGTDAAPRRSPTPNPGGDTNSSATGSRQLRRDFRCANERLYEAYSDLHSMCQGEQYVRRPRTRLLGRVAAQSPGGTSKIC